jgi:hypothetical protein
MNQGLRPLSCFLTLAVLALRSTDAAARACACRKSNPNILVMQSAQDRTAKNMPGSVNTA